MAKLTLSDDEWKTRLTPEQFRVLRQKGTERPFTGEFVDTDDAGMYRCAACNTPLFSSDTKYHSYSGWPSFYDVAERGNVELSEDRSLGVLRIEVHCATCGGHLGHVFDDGPQDKGGLRYCINSVALSFDPATITP